jgi:hypothetical protein
MSAFHPLRTSTHTSIALSMTNEHYIDGLETQRRYDECIALGWSRHEQVSQAFRAIGAAVGSKHQPVSDASKRKLFSLAEQLLKNGSSEVSNAVATCFLDQIYEAAQTGGFDFREVYVCFSMPRMAPTQTAMGEMRTGATPLGQGS